LLTVARYRKAFVGRLRDGQVDALTRRDRVAVWGSAVVPVMLMFALAIAYIDLRGLPRVSLISVQTDADTTEPPAVESTAGT